MYKIILVDDESFTIKAIAKAIKWDVFGFELCGIFNNGFDALEYASGNELDAVISDIRMPQMDGVMLAKKIVEIKPDIKIILASAYKDFEYALEAVRMKVFDYLVKPFDCKTIENMLQKLEKELVNEGSGNKDMFGNNDEDIRIQKLISDFLEHKNRDFLEENVVVDGINLREVPVIIMNIELQDIKEYLDTVWEYGIVGLYNAINNIIRNMHVRIFPLKYSFDNISFVLPAEDMSFEKLFNSFEKLRDKLMSDCMYILNLSVNVEILQTGINLENIISTDAEKSIAVQKKLLISIIKEGNIRGISESITRFCNVFENDEAIIRRYFISTLKELVNLFGNVALKNIDDNFSDIFYIKDINELRKRFETLCIGVSQKQEDNNVYNVIEEAKKYIAEHLENGSSLTEVADAVSLSPPYLSQIFKEQTGEKFLDFVNRKRIEAAQNYLLTSGMKVNDIYKKVGYMSRNYFYNIFKSFSGCSPNEYRKKMRKDI